MEWSTTWRTGSRPEARSMRSPETGEVLGDADRSGWVSDEPTNRTGVG